MRVAGVFVLRPVPGSEVSLGRRKLLLILAITFSLFPLWPHPDPEQHGFGRCAGQWIVRKRP